MNSMDHEDAKKLFSDYLERALDAAQAEELRAHLEQCPGCRAELETLRDTVRSLSDLHKQPPPPEFVSRVEHTIRRRSRGRFFAPEKLLSRLPFEWISFAIILALVAIYLLTVLDRDVRPTPAPQQPDAAAADSAKRR